MDQHSARPRRRSIAASSLPLMVAVSLTGAPALAQTDPHFIDRSAAAPAVHAYTGGWEHFVGGGVAIFDCNGDTRPDLFLAGGASPASLWVNTTVSQGDISFASANLPAILGVTGAYPLDLDSDGFTDLMVLRNGPNLLMTGRGDCTFSDAGAAYGLPDDDRWSTAFSATWEPGNALPTLAIGNYVDAKDPDGPFEVCDTNWLIRPEGATYAPPTPLDPGYCPLSMLFSDWRRDGTPMLRISNDRQYYVRAGYEQMWSVQPLRELTGEDGWPRLQLWGMGIASMDLSGDGLPEVMLTSMGDQMLMANTGTGFATVPFTTGTFAQRPFTGDDGRPSTGWHAEFGDIDNDGLPDLFIAKGNVDQMPDMAMRDPNNLLMQRRDGTFAERADAAGIATTERSRGAGLADLNSDGLLDLVVVNRRAPVEIWQNATPGTGNWIGVRLRQQGANRDAIGAVVELRSGGTVQTQEVTVGGGHVSGRLTPAHFGIGPNRDADLRITWPDGSVSDWHPVEPNRIATIRP